MAVVSVQCEPVSNVAGNDRFMPLFDAIQPGRLIDPA
jgi:hypothetical protein